jgi:hypothetical protein
MWLEFLNVLEDDKPRLSLTKIGLWGTTLATMGDSFGHLLSVIPANAYTTAGIVSANIAAMVKHEMKRWARR